MCVPSDQPPASNRQQEPPGTPAPRAFSCSVDGGQFCHEAWKGIAEELELSPRQVEVCRQLLLANAEKQIAGRLDVSTNTVHTHVRHIYKKLEIRSRTELTTRVFAAHHAWRTKANPPAGCHLKR